MVAGPIGGGGRAIIGGRVQLLGVPQFTAASNQVISGFNDMGRAAGNLSKGVGNLRFGAFIGQSLGPIRAFARLPIALDAVTGSILAATAAVVGFTAEFEKTTAAVAAFGNVSVESLGDLSTQVLELSRHFAVSANDIQKANVALLKAGAEVDDLEKGLTRAVLMLNLASQGEVSVASGAEIVVQALKAFRLNFEDASRIVNVFVGAAQTSSATFGDLVTQFKQAIPVMALSGFTFEETAASIAVLNNAGLRGSVAGTALRNAILSLSSPTKGAAEMMNKYRISLDTSQGETVAMVQFVGQLTKAFGDEAVASGKITEAERRHALSTIFNTREVLSAITLALQGVENYRKQLALVQAVEAETIARSLQQNLISQIQILGNQLVAFAISVGREFVPTLTRFSVALNEFVRSIPLSTFRNIGVEIDKVVKLADPRAAQIFLNMGSGLLVLAQGLLAVVSVAGRLAGEFISWVTHGGDAVDIIVEITANLGAFYTVLGVTAQAIAVFVDGAVDSIVAWANIHSKSMDHASDANRRFGPSMVETFDVFDRVVGFLVDGLFNFAKFWTETWLLLGQTGVQNWAASLRLMGELTAKALKFIADRLTDFANFVGSIPLFSGLVPAQFGIQRFAIDTSNLLNDMSVSASTASKQSSGALDKLANDFKHVRNNARNGIDGLRKDLDNLAPAVNKAGVAAVDAFEAEAEKARARTRAWMEDLRKVGQGYREVEDAHDRWRRAMAHNIKADIASGAGLGAEPPIALPDIDPGKALKGAAEDVDKIADRIRELLSDIPGMTQELADFLAGIVKDFPERLGPMVNALKAAKGQIGEMVLLRRDMLKTDIEIMATEERIGVLEAQQNKVEIQQALAVIGFDRQLLQIRHQLLEIDMQEAPLREALVLIERQISDLQKENLVLTRQRIQLEIDLIPLRKQIQTIEDQIQETQRENFNLRREQNSLEQQALPIRRQILELENAITDVVDKRGQLLRRREEILSEIGVESIQTQIENTQRELDEAWEKFNVPEILRLEEVKTELNESLVAAQDELKGVQAEQRKVGREEELATIELELQKVALEEALKPIERRLELLSSTQEQQNLLNELTRIGLEEQKRLLEDLVKPIQDKLNAIQEEVQLETLRNQLVITFLEEERRAIEAQLRPLEDQRRAIELVSKQIEFLRAEASLEFEERKLQIQEMILGEKLRQAELEETKRQQNLVFRDLVLNFIEAMTQSGAFTRDESLEVAKRLRLWDDQIAKLIENINEFTRLEGEAKKAADAIAAIERDVTITITTVHRDVFQTGGGTAPSSDSGNTPHFQSGGIVPGRRGEPRLITAHGGELIVPVSSVAARETINNNRTIINNFNTTYEVNPQYNQVQSPVQLRDDLRAMVMMSRI